MSNTEFIVTETPNGCGYVKKAFICNGEADLISRINQTAMRGGELIETVEQAIEYLNERHAQTTKVVRRVDFLTTGADFFERVVLEKAAFLGWHEPATEEDGDE